MKITFTATDGTQDNPFTLDVDPSHLRGARTAFGAELHVSGNVESGSARPLAISGVLSWEQENGYGLQIPMQSVGLGTSMVTIPISDHQLASLEAKRAGGEARFQLSVNVLALRSNGQTAMYRPWGPQSYVVPRDRWKEAVEACGFGRIQIVELPVPADANDAWLRSAKTLAQASVCYGQGDYGISIGNTRNALQQIVDVLERALQIAPPAAAFGPRIEVLTKRLKELHEKHSADPYAVLAAVIKSAFDFASDPVHRGYEIPTREDAALALSLTTALHAYVAAHPLPKVEPPVPMSIDPKE